MTSDNSRERQPVTALRSAFVGVAVAFLRRHPFVRHLVGAMGAILLIIGGIFAPLWNVPLLSWLTGGQVAAPCLAGGFGALGVWYLSDNYSQLKPGTVLRRAVAGGAVAYLRGHPVLRFLLGTVGAILLVAGVICFVLRNAAGLSWAASAWAPFLAGGLGALGIWYLSGKSYPSTKSSALTDNNATEPPEQPDLVEQLKQLGELHASGVLTDDEFERAKRRLLQ